jgi:hypothetical protein
MLLRNALRILVLLAFGGHTAWAQSLFVYNIDPSGFPTIRANVVALDELGRRRPTILASELAITENGEPVTDITVNCPPLRPPVPFHAVLVTDRSGSMVSDVGGGLSRMDIAKLGESEFVLATDFAAGASVAVTAFESTVGIISDFQTSAPPLIAAIGTIRASGGTLYDPPFLDPLAGAIGMLATRPAGERRVIVFLTDGEPNESPSVSSILAAATNANVEIYAVTIGMPMNRDLATISAGSGGASFENVNTADQMRAVYQQIALTVGGTPPCELTWRSHTLCGRSSANRAVVATHLPSGARARTSYVAPPASISGIVAKPEYLHFGAVAFPDSLDQQLVLSSPNDSLRVATAEMIPADAFRVIDWGGPPPPFVVPPGIERIVTVRFAPADSQKYVASLVITAPPCPSYAVTLTGGVGRDDGTSLRLLAPLGGEAFTGCDSVVVRWGGVAPATPVDIAASSDDGATWTTVARGVTGLLYTWMPPRPGNWRVKITAASLQEQYVIATRAGGGDLMVDSIRATDAQLLSPAGVSVRGDSLFIAEAGNHRIRRVDLVSGLITTIAGTGNPGLNAEVVARLARLNNPSDVLLIGDYLFVADFGNHLVRRINLQTGSIYTVAGTGASGFSGDDGPGAQAQLQFPVSLASDGTALYVSDAGNQRVRRIELGGLNTITTVAGGGTSNVDGVQATAAALPGLAGIAANDRWIFIAETATHRVRTVDLQTGTITTIAGTGLSGSSGDGGRAVFATLMSPVGLHLAGDILFITDTAAQRVRRVDLATGVITTIAGTGARGFSGDGGDATLARLDEPGQPAADGGFLYVPDIRNGRVRTITIGRGPGSDSSRTSFRVSVAALSIGALRGRALSVGAMALGSARDTSVDGVLCSVGDQPLTIDSAHIVGANASDFSIVSGAPSSEIAPGACAPLEIRFAPSALGPRSAMIILYGRCANVDTVWLDGAGVDSCGASSLELADIGELVLGTGSRDTTVTRALCNTGTRTIGGDVRLVSGAQAFSIVSGAGAFTLAPGQCRTVTIRFEPTFAGRVSGEIDYGIASSCGTVRTRLFGRALGAPELAAPALIALAPELCAGTRDTAFAITNTGGAPLSITSIALVSNDEGFSIVAPNPSAAIPLVLEPGSSATVTIRFAPLTPGAKRATLSIVANDPGSPHVISFAGRRDDARMSADALVAFPSGVAAAPHDTLVTLRNDGTVALEVTGAVVLGVDAASFDVPSAQFPIAVAPQSTAPLLVRLVSLPAAAPLRARVVVDYGPSCDSGRIGFDVVAAGSAPELAWSGVELVQICPGDTARDSVALRNVGGADVRILWQRIENDPAGAFAWEYPVPVLLAPRSEVPQPVRFVASVPGTYTADLVLGTNTDGGSVRIPLVGRRELIAIAASPTTLDLGSGAIDPQASGAVGITNAGTTTTTIAVSLAGAGAFTVDPPAAATLGPGGSTTLRVRSAATSRGIHRDTLIVTESSCGTTIRIPIERTIVLPVVARIALPTMSARPGQRVGIPLSIAIVDPVLFASSGAHEYTAAVTMYGTVVVPDSVSGADLLTNDYDPAMRLQRLVFSGSYDGGDVLAIVHGRTLLGDTLGTPLTFADYAWDVRSVGAELVDGSLTVVGSCLDVGLRIVATPRIVKIHPMPTGDRATLELALDEWQNVRVVLYDERGLPARTLHAGALDAGASALTLDLGGVASGSYTLAVETVYGRSVAPIVVAR